MKLREIKAYVHRNRIADVVNALSSAGFRNLSVIDVQGLLSTLDNKEQQYSIEIGQKVVTQVKLELVCENESETAEAVALIREHSVTGQPDAGWIYISEIQSRVEIPDVLATFGLLLPTSCATGQHHPDSTGIEIQKLGSPTGKVKRAGFVTDQHGLHFHGEVTGTHFTRGPLSGHVDVEIVPPGGSESVCVMGHYSSSSRGSPKMFSLQLDALPESGSVVRVWHHNGENHYGCDN